MNLSMRRLANSRRLLTLALIALAAVGLDSAAGAPSGGPKLKSAKAVDSDRDGSVDAFDLSFSATVRGKADSRAPFRFAVAGYRVTGAAAPRGRTVRVKVSEARVCDLAARPKVSYRPGADGLQSATRRAVGASRVVAGRAPRGAPRIVCAATSDADSDGHVDSVVLGYSKKVRNRAQSSGRMPFQVDRYSVASVGKARGMNLTLRLREKESYDTDALPAVIYNTPRAKRDLRFAVIGSGGRARSSTFNATRDRAIARLVSAATADADQNGLLDSVRATFSEPVRASGGAIEVSGADVTGVTGGERKTLTADIRQALNTAARPSLTLGAGDTLRDAAGNVTARVTTKAEDGAPPVVVSAATSDGGGAPGRIDSVSVNFSEPVSHRADSDGSYPLSVPGYSILSAGEASGSSLVLSLAEGGGSDSGTRPTVGYARGTGAAVTDPAGNEAVGRTYSGTRDGAAPVLIRISLLDTDFDGMVDAARYEYSEPVTHATSDCRVSCSFSLAGYSLEVAGPGVGTSVTVGVTEQAGGATVTTGSYSSLGEGVSDPAGNRAPSASLPTADATPPVAVSAQTVDADDDARIDRIDLTFSEPISPAADTAAPFSFAATLGYAVTGVNQPSGTQLTLSLEEVAAPAFDTGSAPAVSYTGQSTRLTDLNGTEHAIRSYPGLTRDAVAPKFIEARTADVSPAAGNGRLDAVDLIYSEEILGASSATAFTVAGHDPLSGVDYLTDRVRVRFEGTEGSPDTGTHPNVSYTPGDLHDLPEGPGDGFDPAPGVATQPPFDAAGPAVVDAVTGEQQDGATPDGKLDSMRLTFSEPIVAAAGAGTGLALGGGLQVDGASASGDRLDVLVREGAAPVGDLKPTVTVTDPALITDAPTPPNPPNPPNQARGGAFNGTVDGVRPTLVDARHGEESTGGSCESSAVNGLVDCFRATWSEPVVQPSSHTVFSSAPRAPVSVMSTALDDSTDIRVSAGTTPDRDLAGTVSYAGGGGVVDAAATPNPAIAAGPIGTAPACVDTGAEQNDSRLPDNPSMNDALNYTTEQFMCAFDPDWYRVIAQNGDVHVRVDPSELLRVTVRLWDGGTLLDTVTGPTPGAAVDLVRTGLVVDGEYWVEITADGAQEGPYCADPLPLPGENCQDGDDTPQ